MKKIKQIIRQVPLCMGLVFLQVTTHAQTQSISIFPMNSVEMKFIAPASPGSEIEPVMNDTKWLNYNITTDSSDPSVSISAEITSGSIADGLQLQLQAGTFSGTGGGSPGVPAGVITLSNIPQVLINRIGTCNSGSGSNVGHQLTYTMSISDYSALQASSSTIEILFTITQ